MIVDSNNKINLDLLNKIRNKHPKREASLKHINGYCSELLENGFNCVSCVRFDRCFISMEEFNVYMLNLKTKGPGPICINYRYDVTRSSGFQLF